MAQQHKQPAYSEFKQPPLGPSADINRGLAFERYFDQYKPDWSVDAKAQQVFIKRLTGDKGCCKCGDAQALKAANARQLGLAEAQQGEVFWAKSDWRFVTGLGIPHPIENGLLWHPTLATPYLPGSAIKGLVRAALEPTLDKDQLYFLFGSDHKEPNQQSPDRPMKSGALIFMDALPVRKVRLVVDVLTNHMGKWYERGDDASRVSTDTVVPADWQTPNPVVFLSTEELMLQFVILPRSLYRNHTNIGSWITLATEALQWALQHEGAGAKTGTGYGSFSLLDETAARKMRSDLSEKWRDTSLVSAMDETELALYQLTEALTAFKAGNAQRHQLTGMRTTLLAAACEWNDAKRQKLYEILVDVEASITSNRQTRRNNVRMFAEKLGIAH